MKESEINRLFLRVAATSGQASEDVRKVFATLVSSTLRYRDQMKKDLGVIVTVEDVRVALDWLVESIHTKRLPETNNAVRLDLLKIWLDELKPYF
ncbi:MAG: hypothetical protein DRH43_01300 [Deltaproteobacteria bacterium]|nr:MAG: hypothetical protein DRH50_08930 [Deltaproteobacteria bacterium]RLC12535.1 MAG: hypothetical protein DRH43_01300 [Deltaproteobacteria bacterium]